MRQFRLRTCLVADGEPIPGSFWGDCEAGLIDGVVYWRSDTPLHSFLHEVSHYVCMAPSRRPGVHTDAGSDDLEECAVCYLQILLSTHCGVRRERMFADMDEWGYSFRLGSTRAWFEHDAEDAAAWLQHHGLIDGAQIPTMRLRQSE